MKIIRQCESDKLFYLSFMLFVCGQYLLSYKALGDILFYAVLLPVFIWHFRKTLMDVCFKRDDMLCNIVLLLFAYIIAHTLLYRTIDKYTLGIIGSTISNYIFLISAREYFSSYNRIDEFCKMVVIAAGIGAVLSLIDFMIFYQPGVRLRPWNTSDHEIAGASVYAVSGLVALYIFHISQILKEKLYALAAFVLIFTVILLAGSRGPLLALLCSIMVLGVAYYRLRFVLVMLALIAMLGAILYFGYDYMSDSVHIRYGGLIRPDAYRLSIFQLAWEKIKERPLLGYGMRAYFDHYSARQPHNLFLGTAFYLGIPALLVLLAIVGLSFYYVLKSKADDTYKYLVLALLVFGVLGSLTDNSRIVRAPSASWLFYWMPVAMAVGIRHKAKPAIR